jgi:hypothetical protein
VTFVLRKARLSIRPEPGEWYRPASPMSGYFGAFLVCPLCGAHSPISKATHEVRPDGVVSPAWVCRTQPCVFHEHVNLEGYSEPV